MRSGARLRGVRAAGVAMAMAVMAGPAVAQVNPVVVELYTSQGCVSCPPADAAFARLAADPGVIALALHVDYWDYLGWKDVFADPAFTQRQKRYAKAAKARMIYTPQVIVGGVDRVQGTQFDEIVETVRKRAAEAPRVAMRLSRDGGRLVIEAEADPPLERMAVVHLVRYVPRETVAIERGENAGQQITYHNIVSDWTSVAEWSGQGPFRLEAPVGGAGPVAVIVQELGPGPVLAAARLE